MIVLTMFMVLLLLLSINVPIAIGLAVTTIIAMVMKTGTSFLIDTAIVMFDGSMKFPLIAIPLFILAGSIMNSAGISRRLIAFAFHKCAYRDWACSDNYYCNGNEDRHKFSN